MGSKNCVTRLCYLVTKEKGWNSNGHFRQLGKVVSVGETLGFLTLQTVYKHKKLCNTLKKRGNLFNSNQYAQMF